MTCYFTFSFGCGIKNEMNAQIAKLMAPPLSYSEEKAKKIKDEIILVKLKIRMNEMARSREWKWHRSLSGLIR